MVDIADTRDVQLVLVSTTSDSDSDPHLWAAATPRSHALKSVLRVVPLGSSAHLLQHHLSPDHLAALNVRLGDIRDLGQAPEQFCHEEEIMK